MELWECDGIFGCTTQTWLQSTRSDETGFYSFCCWDNNDGTLEGTYDIFIRFIWDQDTVVIKQQDGTVWKGDTAVQSNVPDGPNTINIAIVGSNRGVAGIFDTILIGYDYVSSLGQLHNKVTIIWPAGTTGVPVARPNEIQLVGGDEWDEDVILHEYGHSVQFLVYGAWIPNSQDPNHLWAQCSSNNVGFSEGFQDFWGPAVGFERGWGDGEYPRDTNYDDTVDFVFHSDLEASVPATQGACTEGSIAYTLWDIFDANNDGRDTLSAGMGPIWDVYTTRHPQNIFDFWNGWFAEGYAAAGQPSGQQIWGIYFDHGVNMDTVVPNSNMAALPAFTRSPFTVTWAGNDDLSGVDSFDVQYRDATAGGAWTDWLTATTSTSGVFCNPCPTSQSIEGRAYEFRSRARDRAGNLEAYAVVDARTTIDNTPPSAPSLQLPPNGSTSTTLPTFLWSASTDATSGVAEYTLQLDTSSLFDRPSLRTYTGITTTSFTPPQSLTVGTWYWRVRAVDTVGNQGPYSSTWSVITTSGGGGGGGGCCPKPIRPSSTTSEVLGSNVAPGPVLALTDGTRVPTQSSGSETRSFHKILLPEQIAATRW